MGNIIQADFHTKEWLPAMLDTPGRADDIDNDPSAEADESCIANLAAYFATVREQKPQE